LNKYGVKAGGLGSLFAGGVPTLKKRSQPSPENSSVSEEKHVIASPPVLKKTSVPSVSTPNLYMHIKKNATRLFMTSFEKFYKLLKNSC
jgi:hypothetical protein